MDGVGIDRRPYQLCREFGKVDDSSESGGYRADRLQHL